MALAGALMALVAGGLVLMRADAALLVALVLAPVILVGLRRRESDRWRPAVMGAGGSWAVFWAHMMWREATYGDWIPNTARVKLGFSGPALERGLDYVVSAWLSMPGLGLLTAVPSRAPGWGEDASNRGVRRCRVRGGRGNGVLDLVGWRFLCFARFLVPVVPRGARLGRGAGADRAADAGGRRSHWRGGRDPGAGGVRRPRGPESTRLAFTSGTTRR